ncbi:MAG TPA: protein kinase [Kofleriaceae bacterium]|nr:protein kinase [Kofleriaceae bacterium]
MLGQRIGAYTIERKLGEGGMGVVYAASQDGCLRQVAVKVLLADVSRDQALVQRFFNEVRATTAIEHPSIVQIHGFDYAPSGAAYLVMELLAGETLSGRLERIPRLSVAMAVTFARQIATALVAAHDAGIIHRDLKPDNVFVVPDPEAPGGERIKLLDFGIAKLAHDTIGHAGTITGMLMGSPHYMSPEQCEDAGAVDQRTDLYSLGCILFQMLTGRPPFVADKPVRLISMHLQTPPPDLATLVPGIPSDVDALVRRLLSKSPDERPRTARDVEAELVRCGAISPARRAEAAAPSAVSGAIERVTDHALASRVSDRARRARLGMAVGLGLFAVAALAAVFLLGGDLRGCGPDRSNGATAARRDAAIDAPPPSSADATVADAAASAAPPDASPPVDATGAEAREPRSASRKSPQQAAEERILGAREKIAAGDWSTAIALLDNALEEEPIEGATRAEALKLAAICACNLPDRGRAERRYRALAAAARVTVRGVCAAHDIDLGP